MEGLLQNTWYMAAWESELEAGKVSRRIADVPVVVFRNAQGEIGALVDRCPHRFAPLSMGTVEAGALVCPYHGLGFDTHGKCVVNPFADKVPAGSAVRAFEVVVRDSIVWLWFGDADQADPSLIPDYAFLNGSATNRVIRDYLHLKCHYEYLVDNLMDVTHIEWAHRKTFGGRGLIQHGKHETVQNGNEVWINWSFANVPKQPIPIYHDAAIPWERTDMWIDTRWNAPASVLLDIGQTAPGAPREDGLRQLLAHIVTPETATTSHYFWGVARQHDVDSVEEDNRIRGMLKFAFEMEDVPLVEAAAKVVEGENFWDLKPVHLGPDIGSTRVRRTLEMLVRKESAAAQAQDRPTPR
ncbi:aromatic ring-hydroxylating dioxygenase subunit alpha [Pararobbsia silviterrae]|nr:aromatic ring-hydroxylating dioxygenase subunit alpha [Pararobbsia silviterrae]